MERIVLDTNCLIQSISPRSPYRRIWDSFFDGTNLLCVTTSILNEYEEILNLLTNEETAKYIIDAIVSNPYTIFITVYFDFNLIQKDPDDNKFVDCAITAGARYIVTEDHHYDVIKWKEFPGLDVVGLDEFLKHLLKINLQRNSEAVFRKPAFNSLKALSIPLIGDRNPQG